MLVQFNLTNVLDAKTTPELLSPTYLVVKTMIGRGIELALSVAIFLH